MQSVELWGGDDVHPFMGRQDMACLITHCPGRMELSILRPDGTLRQRPFNDGPIYRCNRVGCYYHEHPRGVHEFNGEWLSKRIEIKEAEK